jgi:hypothetical protein
MDLSGIVRHSAWGRRLSIPMPPHPIAAEQARTLTAMIIGGGDLENTLLVVSELVTNAVKQQDVFWFAIGRHDGAVLIEVTDTSPGCPKIKEPDATDTSGRGLLIVDALSDEWGVRYENDGRKTVWAGIGRTGKER